MSGHEQTASDGRNNAVEPHYAAATIEPIEVIEAWGLGFNLGNALKYIARAGHKDSRADDLLKAANYAYREATGRWLPKELLARLE